jgi:hypothetical protein
MKFLWSALGRKCRTGERAYILQVGVGRMDLWSEFFVERHAPEAIVLNLTSRVEVFPEFVRGLFRIFHCHTCQLDILTKGTRKNVRRKHQSTPRRGQCPLHCDVEGCMRILFEPQEPEAHPVSVATSIRV